MKKIKFWWIVLAAVLIISGCISFLGGMEQPEKKGETEKSENQAELYNEENPERTPGERTVYLDEMTVPVRDDEVMGTVEFLADDHTEITEESVATKNSSYEVYKKNLGKIETIDGKGWRWKTDEEADLSNIYYEESDFWVPQICGMEDEKRQERLNSLLKTESQERFYLSCADVEFYVEYMSEKYLCYYRNNRITSL